jgi:LysR family nitrogen assimilation transcriptional regulator
MNPRHWAYFVTIADLGSFTRAGLKLGVAQPALTRHIRQLEIEFGVELLFRSNRGVVLTEAGQRFYEEATHILRDMDRVTDEMRSFVGDPSGTAILGIAPSLCPVVVPHLLTRQRTQSPRIQLKIVESIGRQLEDWLPERKIDLAIHTEPTVSRKLAFTRLVEEELVLLAGPESELRSPILVSDLAALPLTMTESIRALVERVLEPYQTSLTVEVTLSAIPTILLMVKERMCATIMPRSIAQTDVAAGKLRAFRVTEGGIFRNVVISVASGRPVSTAVSAVGECIREVFAEISGHYDLRVIKEMSPAVDS